MFQFDWPSKFAISHLIIFFLFVSGHWIHATSLEPEREDPPSYSGRRPNRHRIGAECPETRGYVSSATADSSTFATPGSMEMSATSTLQTTSGSLTVHATSSPSTSFDSMKAPSGASSPEHRIARLSDQHIAEDSLETTTTTTTSQSVQVQVSSTLTNSSDSTTSMKPHLSSDSSGCNPILLVNNLPSSAVAREVLRRERAFCSARNKYDQPWSKHNFKDPNRFEWTRRYLYTLVFYVFTVLWMMTKAYSFGNC